MSSELQTIVDGVTVERVLLHGDLQKLTASQKVAYYAKVCESLGFNPLTRPFEYIVLNGKETLYAKREATEQLRKIHKVSLTIQSREVVEETYIVTARAALPDGRTDESIGAKSLSNLKGEARANAMMTAETKAKRRVTLSICGLGLLDETEVADLPPAALAVPPSAVIKAPPETAPPPPWPNPAFTVTPPVEAVDVAPHLAAGFVRIEKVEALPTKNPSVTRYTITLSTGELVTTINDWKATLAKNYCEDRTPVRVETKKTKFGDELKSIKTADEAREPDPPVPLGDIPF